MLTGYVIMHGYSLTCSNIHPRCVDKAGLQLQVGDGPAWKLDTTGKRSRKSPRSSAAPDRFEAKPASCWGDGPRPVKEPPVKEQPVVPAEHDSPKSKNEKVLQKRQTTKTPRTGTGGAEKKKRKHTKQKGSALGTPTLRDPKTLKIGERVGVMW